MVSHSFYVHLPSNVREEGNSTASFTIKLARKLEFNSNWCVSLTSITFPHSWFTCGSHQLQHIDITWTNGQSTRLYVPSTTFTSVQDLEAGLKHIIANGYLCSILPTSRAKRETPLEQAKKLKEARLAAAAAPKPQKLLPKKPLTDQEIAQIQAEDEKRMLALSNAQIDELQQEDRQKIQDKSNNVIDAIQASDAEKIATLSEKNIEKIQQEDASKLQKHSDHEITKMQEEDAEKQKQLSDSLINAIQIEDEHKIQTLNDRNIAELQAEDAQKIANQNVLNLKAHTNEWENLETRKRVLEQNILQPLQSAKKTRQRYGLPPLEARDFPQFLNQHLAEEHDSTQCQALRLQTPFNELASDLKVKFDSHYQKFFVDFNTQKITSLRFSSQLAYILGLPEETCTAPGLVDFQPSLNGGIENLYIYAPGLIEHSIVGNRMAPLLKIVKIQGAPGTIIQENVINPEFCKLNEKQISQIIIDIRDDSGRLVKFQSGHCILTLNFRKLFY